MIISDTAFASITDYIEAETGISIPEANFRNVKNFLEERFTGLGLDSESYLFFVKNNTAEYDRLINAVTINETYFFREEKQFAIFDANLLPEIINRESSALAFWSAACSTGEEAFSLAAIIHKHQAALKGKDYSIYATDLNPYVLETLKAGIYKGNSFREDGAAYRHLLSAIGKDDKGVWQPGAEVRKHIRILRFNLFNHEPPRDFPSQFQFIFFRNTLIYMKPEYRLQIIDRLWQRLAPGGYLFLSIAETPLITHPRLSLVEMGRIFFFKKTEDPVKNDGRGLHQAKTINHFTHNEKEKTTRETAIAFDMEYRGQANRCVISFHEIARIAKDKNEAIHIHDNNDLQLTAIPAFLDIIFKINSGQIADARSILQCLEEKTEPHELIFYLYGYMDLLSDNRKDAINNFRKAVLLNHNFWLARFYLARLLAGETPEKARREFLLCREYLGKYIKNGHTHFEFLLEGFNARYFEKLCDKWLEQLTTGSISRYDQD